MIGSTRSDTNERTVSRTRRSSSASRSSTSRRSSAWNGRVIGLLLHPLDQQGDSLAAADAERRQAETRAAPPHLVKERDRDARSRRADRMAQRDGAAVDVDAGQVELEIFLAREDLGGERFVDLDEIDVAERQARLLQQGAHGGNGADSHDGGIDSRDGVRDDARLRN